MASSYERELRAVLAGSPDGVRAVTRSCTEIERARAMQVVQRPFLVVRAAGSGMDGSGDLLALRGDLCFPIEVKTRAEKKVYLSGQKEEQLQSMKEIGEKCELMPLYAHRLKGVRGDSWRIFRVETSTLSGRLATLARRIPTLPLTRTGKRKSNSVLWPRYAIGCGRPVGQSIVTASGGMVSNRVLTRVDFPDPLCPTTASTSPSARSKETSSTTVLAR